jgi:Caspase domain
MNLLLSLALIVASPPSPNLDIATTRPPSLRRLALVAGANRAAERPSLRYAVRDAERFTRVLTAMGGVAPADAALLKEPSPKVFKEALAALSSKAVEARRSAARVEVLVYYSGHADEQGLMLGAERLGYADLRAAIRAMPVDVGIAVLDACASGAITRLKGGQAYPAFMSDVSMDVQGYAFLASSSEGEAAQESDRLGGSYFTGALITGMRGAADVSGDGRVTLGEAYQFAFNETLAQTTTSQGGAQHPSYDIKMAGTGDVVMTDVRKISASLILGKEYDGRFYVLDASQHLVAELQKGEGRAIELGLEPGDYRVYYEQAEKLMSAPLRLAEGQRQELVRGGLRPAKRLPTLRRGGEDPSTSFLQRNRVEGGGSMFGGNVEATRSQSKIGGGAWGWSALHFIRPEIAIELAMLDRGIVLDRPGQGAFIGSTRAGLLGARYYPPARGSLRPFALAGAGLFDDVGVKVGTVAKGLGAGGQIGFGVDLKLWRRITVSGQGVFVAAVGRESRFDLRFASGWNFGGRAKR